MNIKMILTNAFNLDVRVYKEAKYLVSQGDDVEILCWDKTPEKGLPAVDENAGIKVRRFGIPAVEGSGYKQIWAYLSFIRECRKYLNSSGYDVLHCHDMDGAIVGYISKAKFIFDMHEFYDKGGAIRKQFSHFIVCYLAKKSRANIYVSERNLISYGRGIEAKFFPLKNYSDFTMFGKIDKTPSPVLRIAYIGRVRNQIAEFRALIKAVEGLDYVRVDIFGDGPDLGQLKSMSEGHTNVFIHGAYNGVDDSERIYRNTDMSFVAYNPQNPNYQGEFEPVKLYEAIFTKTPIIATKAIFPGRIAEEKKIGIAVDTRSSDEIRKAIMYVHNNRDKLHEYSSNMESIAGQYDWNQAVKILDKAYSAV